MEPVQLEDTIDASDRSMPAKTVPVGSDASPRADYSQLVVVERHHYAVTGEIARGGMGRVIEARDLRLGRQVAIKELLPKNRDVARRFEREARITARLQHPSIIHVYEAGVWPGGEPFYAMPKVSGRSLDKVVAERSTLEERLALLPNVIAVADALAYAHNENVIHRDLKPGNVIVGEFGETVVIDWGLAKDIGERSDPRESLVVRMRAAEDETIFGGVVGTPAYMPPEQARGESLDQRADVYSLGALLYKLLCGAAPYHGTTALEILEEVKAGPPVPVHERVTAAPTELVAIVAKAMSRNPADRYSTASELARDLKRFETGQLVGAHRYTPRDLIARWLRKHRVALSIAALALAVLVVVGVLSVMRIIGEKQRADAERKNAERGRSQLLEERGRAELAQGHAGAALAYLVGAARDGRTAGARGFLIADAMRPFQAEVAHLAVGDGATAVAVSIDGTRIAVAGTREVAVWDRSGRRVVRFDARGGARVVALDGQMTRLLAAGDDGVARVWSLANEPLIELRGHDGAILDAAFAPDGRSVVTTGVDGTVRQWDLATRTAIVSTCHRAPVVSVRYSLDGTRVVTASADATACVLDARSGATLVPLRGHTGPVHSAMFSEDGTLVVTASADGTARVWDVETGKLAVAPLAHDGGGAVHVAVLSRDGYVLTAGSDPGARLWTLPAQLVSEGRPPAAKLVHRLTGHSGTIVAGSFGADDTLVATGAFDGTARTWDVRTGELVATFEHGDVVSAVAFVPGSSLLATASRDGAGRLWNVEVAKVRSDLETSVHAIAVGPHGEIAAARDDSKVSVLRGRDEQILHGHVGRVFTAAFTGDGRLITAGEDDHAIVWNLSTGARAGSLGEHLSAVRALAVMPRDADTVLMLVDGQVQQWSLSTGQLRRKLDTGGARIRSIAVSPTGERIAGASTSGDVRIWDKVGSVLGDLRENGRQYTAIAFGNDTQLLAAGTGIADIWHVVPGSSSIDSALPPGVLRAPAKPGFAIATSLDGSLGVVDAVVFTDDGTRVITAGGDGRALIWDAAKGKLLGSRQAHDGAVTALAVEGDTLWMATSGGTIGAWEIRVETGSADELDTFMVTKHVTVRLGADDVLRRAGAR